VITSNGCGAALQPGASCDIAVAFAPKTRSGTRSASLAVTTPSDAAANVSLSGAALPALSLLAGALGGVGTLDGTGATARFRSPRAIAGDGAGNLYIGDFANRTIRKIVLATGVVTTLAGTPGQQGSVDGTGAAARFNGPFGMVSDGAGNLYVGDGYTIRKVVTATGAVTTIAGAPGQEGSTDGVGAAARFYGSNGIASDGAGNLYVTDTSNDTIRKVVIATGAVTTIAGKPLYTGSDDGTVPPHALPDRPTSSPTARATSTSSTRSTARSARSSSRPAPSPPSRARRASTTRRTGRARPPDSATRRAWSATGPATSTSPTRATAPSGRSSSRPAPSRPLRAAGAAQTERARPAGFYEPRGIVGDGTGNLYVTDYGNQTIRKVAIATAAVTTIAGAASQARQRRRNGSAARFAFPQGIVSDGTGNVYVADNRSIRKVVVATGAVSTLAGSGSASGSADGVGPAAGFSGACGIAADGAGNLFVAETGSNSIRKIVIATAAVTTLAGAPGELYPGNVDGTGAAARFNGPKGIAADSAGNLFVADTGNNTIRKLVVATGAVTTFAGGGTGLHHGRDGYGRPVLPSRPASRATARATSSSPTRKTAPSGRSSSRQPPSRRSQPGAATSGRPGASPATGPEASTSPTSAPHRPRPAPRSSGRSTFATAAVSTVVGAPIASGWRSARSRRRSAPPSAWRSYPRESWRSSTTSRTPS
jgi:hypothetical protein